MYTHGENYFLQEHRIYHHLRVLKRHFLSVALQSSFVSNDRNVSIFILDPTLHSKIPYHLILFIGLDIASPRRAILDFRKELIASFEEIKLSQLQLTILE